MKQAIVPYQKKPSNNIIDVFFLENCHEVAILHCHTWLQFLRYFPQHNSSKSPSDSGNLTSKSPSNHPKLGQSPRITIEFTLKSGNHHESFMINLGESSPFDRHQIPGAMRAIQESVAKSRQAALERTLQRQAEEEAAQEAGCDMPGICRGYQ